MSVRRSVPPPLSRLPGHLVGTLATHTAYRRASSTSAAVMPALNRPDE